MFGRFFAFEMGCPEDDAAPPLEQVMTLDEIYAQAQSEGQDTSTMICECKGLGCNKCKRKKAKIITLTGVRGPVPVMNTPLSPFQPSMIMMARRNLF